MHTDAQSQVTPPLRGSKVAHVRDHLLGLVTAARNGEGGTRMPSERTLAARFAVSRPTARAALRGLLSDGQIVATPGLGYFAVGTDAP